ncbi:MAG: hypothetical protein HUJ96_03490 [Marinilabiliaceae bacterium]|nr:hypothetical protein [Marinilabiliaceae bacterium]
MRFMHKENQNTIVGYFDNGSGVQTAMFVTNISKEVVKNMNFDDLKAYYEKCLNDEEKLKILCLNNYKRMRLDYHKDDTEADKEELLKVIQNNADQIFKRERTNTLSLIHRTLEELEECLFPISERQELVTAFLEPNMEQMVNCKSATADGRILWIQDNIPDDVFIDIYYILADEICGRFQLNQLGGKYREGLFHCLQFLDYKYHFSDFSNQYPNESPEFIERCKRTTILDLVTGRDNAYFDVDGRHYICKAFMEKGCKFRIEIEEVEYIWNMSNGGKNDFVIERDKRKLYSTDIRNGYLVELSSKQMAIYTYIYDNDNVALDDMYKDMDNFKNNYLYKQDTDSKIEKYNLPEFKRDIKKRVSEINQKVNEKLGKAYTILVYNEQCYIPIGRDERLEQKL